MAINRERILAALAITRIPPDLCWGKPADFIKQLVESLTVTLDIATNTDFVVIGHEVPSEDDKGRLWIRLQRNGSFLGFYLFVNGKWQRVFNRRSDEIIWMYGDSRNIPDGFQLVDDSSPVPTDVKDHIMKQYLVDTSVNSATPVYRYFALTYVGV